jgi:hypothetical protein
MAEQSSSRQQQQPHNAIAAPLTDFKLDLRPMLQYIDETVLGQFNLIWNSLEGVGAPGPAALQPSELRS